jgi:hypothetical protein
LGIGGDSEDICDYHEGLAVICAEGETKRGRLIDAKFGYIDLSGNVVIQPIFKSASSFSEGLAVVMPSVKETVPDQQNSINLADNKFLGRVSFLRYDWIRIYIHARLLKVDSLAKMD